MNKKTKTKIGFSSNLTSSMDFNNLDDIRKAGFIGFKTMQELSVDSSRLPAVKGVYLVLNLDKEIPAYLEVGTGGHFKGKNPNVSLAELKANWVDKTLVVYIGKAGGDSSSATFWFWAR